MVFGLTKKKQIDEHEAEGEVERIYHEIRQTLRVNGVNLVFRAWARYDKFFPAMWDSVRPNAETRVFEDAADAVRERAVREAETLGKLDIHPSVRLGESQIYQLKAALDLYHYINPKLLIIISALRLSLSGEFAPAQIEGAKMLEQIERGAPARMYPMEMVSEDPKEQRLSDLFDDIKQTLSVSSVSSDYRTLALWPDYLAEAWNRLKPLVKRQEYIAAAEKVRTLAREGALELPFPILGHEQLDELGEDVDEIRNSAEKFEDLVAPMIINIALLELDWHDPQRLMRSPFPAAVRK